MAFNGTKVDVEVATKEEMFKQKEGGGVEKVSSSVIASMSATRPIAAVCQDI